jgi:hypothetical protein
MPLPSLLLAPITLTAGPEISWNLLLLASPALSAWTGYLLCRHVTRGRLWPSLAGGYVFGFSPYMLTEISGAPNLALVPLVPVFVLLVLRRLDGTLGERGFVAAMAAALAAQYLISTEVLLTSAFFGGIALVLAILLLRGRRRELLRVAGLLVVAFAAMAVVVSPFLAAFLLGDHYPPVALYFSTDVAAFVLPPHVVALTKSHDAAHTFRGASGVGYLGVPLLALVAAFLWQWRRRRVAWLLVACMVIPAVASLGPGVIVRGKLTDITLPWELVDDLPLLQYLVVSRFSLYVTLAAAVVVALWVVPGGIARWALTALAIAAIVPWVGHTIWQTKITTPAFFESGDYRSELGADDRVLAVPVGGPNERWQAEADFRFKLVGGYLSTSFPKGYTRFPTWMTLRTGQLSPDYARDLRRFVRAKDVTAVVVDKREPGPWRQLFDTLGVRPSDTGGVLVYRLSGGSG